MGKFYIFNSWKETLIMLVSTLSSETCNPRATQHNDASFLR